jgi:hypothetical protein
MTPTPCMIWHKMLHYITKYPLTVPFYSAPHTHTHARTPNQGKSIKLIDIIHHFPHNIIFIIFYIIRRRITYVATFTNILSQQHTTILYFIILIITNFS